MGIHWSQDSARLDVRKRIEALTQPMPEHEVTPVDLDTQAALSKRSAVALVIAVLVLAALGGLFVGCSVMEGHKDPAAANSLALPGGAPGKIDAGRASGNDSDNGQPQPTSVSSTPAAPGQQVVVSVQGMVRSPGLIHLPADVRVGEAIERAGGALPDSVVVGINLAERVSDGMQIVINREGSSIAYAGTGGNGGGATAQGEGAGAVGNSGGQPGVGGASGTNGTAGGGHSAGTATGGSGGGAASGAGGTAGNGAKVNINQADSTLLQTLDGVGPATAEAIIAWRQANGKFSSIEQLMEVRGIGSAKFEAMKNRVTV